MTPQNFQRHLLTLCLLVFSTPLSATSLNWNTCATLAKQNNPDLHIEQAKVDSSRAQITVSQSRYWPQLNLNATLSQSNGPANYGASLSLTETLFPDVFSQPEVQRSQAALAIELANQQALEASIRSTILQALADLEFAQRTIVLSQQITLRRVENAKLVNARFRAGRENQGSYQRAKAQADQSQLDDVQAKRALDLAKDALVTTLGLPQIEVTTLENPSLTLLPKKSDLETWVKQSPQYKAAEFAVKQAEWDLQIAQNKQWPTLTAGLSTAQDGSFGSGTSSGLTTGQLTGSLPLFTGGLLTSQVEIAKLNLKIQKWNLEKTKLQTQLTLKRTYIAAINAVESDSIQDEFVKSADLRSEIAQAQYTTGLITYDSWDIIENDRINQAKVSLQRKHDIRITAAQFEETIGKGFDQ